MTTFDPFASNDGVRGLCTRCGLACPANATSCSSCGADFGGEAGGETVLDAPRPDNTALDARAFQSEPPPSSSPSSSSAPKLLPFSEETNEETNDDTGHLTAEVLRRLPNAELTPMSGSSSDPPTRFVRRGDHHVELPTGCVVADYEIEARLGEGAMGVVYSAIHTRLGRRVALKVIAPTMGQDPQALARFEREARALASLQHPNIVDVYAFGSLPDGRSYFVMEYLVGATLHDWLARGRVPLDEALDVLDQMARALEVAHAQGIVHRDLKPSNTFLVRLPREHHAVVKLLDFGLVKTGSADGVENTATGVVIGTALYLSPEQARGPNVDGRTDIYALGVIAYELVLGRHPFPAARTPTAALAAHLTELPPQPRSIWSGIPVALDLLLFSMLAKDPIYRPTLVQVRHVIASVRSSSVAGARRAATVSVRRRALHARLWIAALVALALVVGIAIGASALGRRSIDGGEAGFGGPLKVQPPTTAPRQAPTIVPILAMDAGLARQDAQLATTIDEPPPHPEPRPAAPIADNGLGVLTLDSKPWTEILVDGAREGRTPIVGLRLPVGHHKITLINATYSIKESFRVEIKPGKVEKIVKDYSDRPDVVRLMAADTKTPQKPLTR